MALSDLQSNGIYVILFLRDDQPDPDNFHWGLYHHHNADSGGWKYHIKGRTGYWHADHGHTKGVFKSFLLIGLFHICTIPPGWEAHVDAVMRQYDGVLNNNPATSCSAWLFWVLAQLQKPVNGYRILSADLGYLEREIKDFGNMHSRSAVANNQPRPIGRSVYAG
ncbi:hypothetical protein EJ05DRAFT_537401 [Pseudovirgaria hyperparasitica]|uniref:Uncharacterized protein n=1 Tax=Pseudovirgaria hyperparasitica TaxID=470096 RepID=A0A6A6WA45_9PEZI|nr:uncharacterized protein EJ05DRAFT_537401 [Pseudovirgaria hyperparasitica]KAF2759039.1 hypothetical protein EJ05DRAFT_537401 [Pseudovirgaria hyperparasitica]